MPDGAGMAPSNNQPRNELSDRLAPSGMVVVVPWHGHLARESQGHPAPGWRAMLYNSGSRQAAPRSVLSRKMFFRVQASPR